MHLGADAIVLTHECDATCTLGDEMRTDEGTLSRTRRHSDTGMVWFTDEFIGPRAVYIVADKIGQWDHPMAAPLTPEQEKFWNVVAGPFGSDEHAKGFGRTQLGWPQA